MIVGRSIASKTLTSAKGRSVQVDIIAPEPSEANIQALSETSAEWRRVYIQWAERFRRGELPFEAPYHALFASDVAFMGGRWLKDRRCCVIVAQEQATGRVLGVGLYTIRPGGYEAYINLLTVSPENQPSSPEKDQLRGVGTELLSAMAKDWLERGTVAVAALHPLDAAADAFWRARGFHNTRGPLKIEAREFPRLAALCTAEPDMPERGDTLFVGEFQELAPIRTKEMLRWRR